MLRTWSFILCICQRKCPEGHQNAFIAPDVELIRKLPQLSFAFSFSTPVLCLIVFIFHSSVLVVIRAPFLARGSLFNLVFLMFIGKLLLGAVFDPLPCLDKIKDGLLLWGIVDESKGPDSVLAAPCGSTLLQVSVFWSGSSSLGAKHSGRSAGWRGSSLCLGIFCLSFPSLF